jgi:hypothetical protein
LTYYPLKEVLRKEQVLCRGRSQPSETPDPHRKRQACNVDILSLSSGGVYHASWLQRELYVVLGRHKVYRLYGIELFRRLWLRE